MILVIGKDSAYRQGLMVKTLNHGIDMDLWYRHVLMELLLAGYSDILLYIGL